MKFEELISIIKKRKEIFPERSYVVSLLKNGEDRILQKIGEETTEVIIAAKEKRKRRTLEEISDLLFMIMVLLVQKNISLEEIYDELEKRRK